MAFSATDAAFEGFRLTRRAPLAIVWWGVAYVLFIGIFFALAWGPMSTFVSAMEAIEGQSSPNPDDFMPAMGAYFSVIALAAPAALLFSAVLNAAVARAVIHPEQKAFGYLRLGGDELRVLAVSIVLGIVFFIACLVPFVVGAGLIGVGAQGGNGGAVAGGVLVILATGLGILALAVKLSLAIPITVAEKRIAIFDSWKMTKGKFWPMVGMTLIAFVLSVVVSLLGSVIMMPITLAFGAGTNGLERAMSLGLDEALRTMAPFLVVYVVINAILAALQLAILYAPFAAAYLGIKGPGVKQADTFA